MGDVDLLHHRSYLAGDYEFLNNFFEVAQL